MQRVVYQGNSDLLQVAPLLRVLASHRHTVETDSVRVRTAPRSAEHEEWKAFIFEYLNILGSRTGYERSTFKMSTVSSRTVSS